MDTITTLTNSLRVFSAQHTYNITGNLTGVVNSRGSETTTTPTVNTAYTLDTLDRRMAAKRQDGSAWNYQYNDRSEVVDAHKSLNGMRLAGMDRTYAYDNIGNRTLAREGGNGSGGQRRVMTYQTNDQNLYTSITRTAEGTAKPRGVDITGTTESVGTLTVNGLSPNVQGPWWRAEIQPVTSTEYSVTAAIQNTNSSEPPTLRIPPSPPAVVNTTSGGWP